MTDPLQRTLTAHSDDRELQRLEMMIQIMETTESVEERERILDYLHNRYVAVRLAEPTDEGGQ